MILTLRFKIDCHGETVALVLVNKERLQSLWNDSQLARHYSHGGRDGTIKPGDGRGGWGGKSPSEQNPRAIVVYPARLCSPLVDILPRRGRFLIPRCRFGIIYTFCSFERAMYDYSLLAIPPGPGPWCRDQWVGHLWVGAAYENATQGFSKYSTWILNWNWC